MGEPQEPVPGDTWVLQVQSLPFRRLSNNPLGKPNLREKPAKKKCPKPHKLPGVTLTRTFSQHELIPRNRM